MRFFDAVAGSLADWSEFDAEAERFSIEVRGISCEDLRALIESSTRQIPSTEHRRLASGSVTRIVTLIAQWVLSWTLSQDLVALCSRMRPQARCHFCG